MILCSYKISLMLNSYLVTRAVGSFLEFTQDGAEVVSLYFVSYGSAYLTSTLLILVKHLC